MHIWSGKTYFVHGKIREISGNFIPQNLWPPWLRFCDFFYVCCFHLSHLGHWEIGLNRRETCQFECFIASFNLFKVLQGSFLNEYWHMLTFPTGKYRLIIPPAKKLGGVYWNHPVRLSVCLSVRPSVCRRAVR